MRLGSGSLSLLLVWLVACGDETPARRGAADAVADAGASAHDLGALRASAVDGIEAGLGEPGTQLGLADALAAPALAPLRAAQLDRLAAEPELARAVDELFVALQRSEGMRALVLEHAGAHPEQSPAQLAEGLGALLQARLTRAELVAALRRALLGGSEALEPSLSAVFVHEAGGAQALADAVVARLETPELAASIRASLGREGVGARLQRRLADPRRASGLLTGLAAFLASEPGLELLGGVLAEPVCDAAIGALAQRLLADTELRVRFEMLFGLAVAQQLDVSAFVEQAEALLAEPGVTRELEVSLRTLARERVPAARVRDIVEAFSRTPSFERALRSWIGLSP